MAIKKMKLETQEQVGESPIAGKTFATIICDPNWSYSNFGAAKHGAARAHYPGSTVGYISGIPVSKWSRSSTTLFLWATLPKLDEAIDVMRAWGFELVTAVPWVKTTPNSGSIRCGIGFWFQATSEILLICRMKKGKSPKQKDGSKALGLLTGTHFNKNSEEVEQRAAELNSKLIQEVADFRSKEGLEEKKFDFLDYIIGSSNRFDSAFYAPRGHHSRKPLSIVEWIETRMPGPRLELYATSERPGWTCIGHNTGWHISRDGVTKYLPEIHG
jgi:N6-adenosine-specific RNA methylase IME4